MCAPILWKPKLKESQNDTNRLFQAASQNLHSDIKTQFFNEDKEIWDYKPRFFNVNGLVLDFDLDEEDPKIKTLGKAQWIIAQILGLKSWQDLIHSDPVTLELHKLMFEHQNEISPIDCFVNDFKTTGNTMLRLSVLNTDDG